MISVSTRSDEISQNSAMLEMMFHCGTLFCSSVLRASMNLFAFFVLILNLKNRLLFTAKHRHSLIMESAEKKMN
jgi:hypothetical protein